MSPVAVSADRRFHRAHVKPARRRAVWRSVAVAGVKCGVLLVLVLFAATRVQSFVQTSPLLRIDRIVMSGNQRVPTEAVSALLGGLHGENILSADLEAFRDRLMASPWIADASFRRALPSTLEVMVRERTPIAIGRKSGQLYLVDERGAAIDAYGPQYEPRPADRRRLRRRQGRRGGRHSTRGDRRAPDHGAPAEAGDRRAAVAGGCGRRA